MHTPVLLIIFNRFDTTQQVMAKLREGLVPKLYVYCDGPRKEKLGEAEQLRLVQEQVLSAIDWPCELITNFKTENEGPRLAIGHAVSWLFETEERGIILEHDCVPHLSFFNYCETLLKHGLRDPCQRKDRDAASHRQRQPPVAAAPDRGGSVHSMTLVGVGGLW
jgi:hypothetical protein